VTNEPAPARPLGWWLKEADARLDAAFERAFAEAGTNRREWQVLSTLAGRPTDADDLVAALSAFSPPAAVRALLDDLAARGQVFLSEGTLQLTAAGARTQAELASRVAEVRQRVSSALPPDDYVALVRLLERLVEGLREP
jgi:hypothetical protein